MFKYEEAEDYKAQNGYWLRHDKGNKTNALLVYMSEGQIERIVNFLNGIEI